MGHWGLAVQTLPPDKIPGGTALPVLVEPAIATGQAPVAGPAIQPAAARLTAPAGMSRPVLRGPPAPSTATTRPIFQPAGVKASLIAKMQTQLTAVLRVTTNYWLPVALVSIWPLPHVQAQLRGAVPTILPAQTPDSAVNVTVPDRRLQVRMTPVALLPSTAPAGMLSPVLRGPPTTSTATTRSILPPIVVRRLVMVARMQTQPTVILSLTTNSRLSAATVST